MLFSNIAIAQHSALYHKNRQLIIDPSYSIDENTYSNISVIEKVLLPTIYNNIKYPEIARENGDEGIVIVQLSIDNKAMSYDYKIIKSAAKIFNQPVMDFFGRMSKYKRDEICPAGQSIIVYVPIKFYMSPNSFKKSLKKNHSVTVEANDLTPEAAIVQ